MSKAQTQAYEQYRNEHLSRIADAPEGYVQGRRQKGILTPKAFLVALWCKEGLQALRNLKPEQKAKAIPVFKRAQAQAREGGTFTASSLLACIKAALVAVTSEPVVSQDFAAEVEFVAQAATLADKDLGDTVRLLAGYFQTGGKTSRGEDLSDSGRRGQAYIRACRAVNGLAGKKRDSVRKTQVIRNLCQDSPFGEALGEVVLYLVRAAQAQELANTLQAQAQEGKVKQALADDAQAQAERAALGVPKVLHSFRVWSGILYDGCIQRAKEKRAEALAEAAAETPETVKFRRSLDGGLTWTEEEAPLSKPKGKMRTRKRVAGIQTVSWEVLQEKAWRKEERLAEAEAEAMWD